MEVDSIQPGYVIPRCQYYDVQLDTNTFTCVEVMHYILRVTPLIPPFSYKFHCSSLLLSAYIPVYFYISAIEIVSVFILIGCLLLQKDSYIRQLSQMGKMGILWPQFWSHLSTSADNNDKRIATPELLLNSLKIATNDIVCSGAIQLTFGLTSPVLTMAVMISFYLKLSMWMMMVGRFLYHRINISVESDDESGVPRRSTIVESTTFISEERNIQLNQDNALVALGDTYLDIPAIFVSCFWPIVYSSSCFIAALSWDMAADKEAESRRALWAPVTALSMPLFLWIVDIELTKGRNLFARPQQRSNDNKNSSSIEIVDTSLNPLSINKE